MIIIIDYVVYTVYNGEASGARKLGNALIKWYTRCIRLKELDFQWVSLCTDGAQAIARALTKGACRKLITLNLRGNHIL